MHVGRACVRERCIFAARHWRVYAFSRCVRTLACGSSSEPAKPSTQAQREQAHNSLAPPPACVMRFTLRSSILCRDAARLQTLSTRIAWQRRRSRASVSQAYIRMDRAADVCHASRARTLCTTTSEPHSPRAIRLSSRHIAGMAIPAQSTHTNDDVQSSSRAADVLSAASQYALGE